MYGNFSSVVQYLYFLVIPSLFLCSWALTNMLQENVRTPGSSEWLMEDKWDSVKMMVDDGIEEKRMNLNYFHWGFGWTMS